MAESIPSGAVRYDLSARYNEHTIPREWIRMSPLAENGWARVVVHQGELELTLRSAGSTQRVTPDSEAVIPPDTPFKLSPRGPVAFHLEYYRLPRIHDADTLAAELGR